MKIHPILKKSLLFLIILVALNEGIKLYFYNVTAKKMKLVQRDEAFFRTDGDLDYLFLGHSRPLSAVDPTGYPKIFNFASGGESNIYTYYKLKYILEESSVKAKTVVLPCGFGTYNMRDIEHTTNSFYWSQYVDYLEIGKMKDEWFDYLGVVIKAKLFPYFQHPARALDRTYMNVTGELNHRMKLADIPEEQREQVAYESILANHDNRALYDSISLVYLEKTIALCEEHSQDVVFVRYPVTEYYGAAAERFVDEFELTGTESVSADLDFSNLYYDRPEFFRDVNHLNSDGAAAFTGVLMEGLSGLR